MSTTDEARRLQELASEVERLEGELAQARGQAARYASHLGEVQRLANVGIWDWNIARDELSWSDELYAIFGLGDRSITSFQDFLRLMPEPRRAALAERVDRARLTLEGFEFESQITRPDESTRTVFARVTVFADEAGVATRMVGTVLDMTDRHAIKDELYTSEARLRAIVDHTPDIIFIKDLEGRYRFVNPSAAAYIGLSSEQILGRTDAAIFPPELARDHQALDRAVIESGETMQSDYAIGEPPAQPRYFSRVKFPLVAQNGHLAGVVGILRETTEQRRTETELLQQRELLTRMLDNTPLGTAFLDRNLVFRWANPAYFKGWKRPEGSLIDRSLYEVFPDVPRNNPYETALRTQQPTHSASRAIMLPGDDGEPELSYWDITVVPILAPDGASDGVLIQGLNVTDRVERERLQNDQIARLQELDRMKTQFVNSVSHEFRTPLTSIRGYLEFLEDELGGPANGEQQEYIQQAKRGTTRLETLVDDLLDFARIEAGTFRLRVEPADLSATLQEVANGFRPLAREAGVELSVEPASEPLVLDFDAQRIGQVLLNFLSNAVKFTPAGGAITMRARAVPGAVRVSVSDTGIGIDPADQDKLFMRFSQLANVKQARSVRGTGLGLSICKAIVEAHGGSVGVESALGQGSTFWFELPRPAAGEGPGPEGDRG